MSNTTSPSATNTSGSNDVISNSMTQIAMSATKQKRLLFVGIVILLAATLAASLYLTKRNAFRAQAAEALFKARSTLETEMKAFATSIAPPAKKADPKVDPKAAAKAAPKDLAAPVAPPSTDFVKFDVDTKLAGSVTALEGVAKTYPNTLAGFDAKMELGSIYFEHGEGTAAYEKALRWFESAANSAPGDEYSSTALYSQGYAQEALGQCPEAVKTFDRAVNAGAGALLGELLRAKARCQEIAGDKAGARTTYEAIAKQLPNTEHARFAETKKAAL